MNNEGNENLKKHQIMQMNIEKLLEITSKFIEKKNPINNDYLNDNDNLKDNLTLLIKKLKNIEQFLGIFNIQIVVTKLPTVASMIDKKDLLNVLNIESLLILNELFTKYKEKLPTNIIHVTFIADSKFDKSSYYIFRYLLYLTHFVEGNRIKHDIFNNNLKKILQKKEKRMDYYAIQANKSLINTIYGIKDIKRNRKKNIR